MYAVHMTRTGASFTGELEEFVTGTPLPLTDLVINPADGAMYFAIGGRKTQSGLYRVTYVGENKPYTGVADVIRDGNIDETYFNDVTPFLGEKDPKAVETAWPKLRERDRYVRYAARTALEWNPSTPGGPKPSPSPTRRRPPWPCSP